MKNHDYPIGYKTFLLITLSVSKATADSISLWLVNVAESEFGSQLQNIPTSQEWPPHLANVLLLYTKILEPREVR